MEVCNMILRYTEEVKKLQEIYRPYLDGCHLRDDAPAEAVEAFQKFKDWVNEQYRKAGME
jgi:hypothetical protein